MAESTYDYYWWKRKKYEAHESVFPYLKKLEADQGYRQEENIKNMRLYGNMEYSPIAGSQSLRAENAQGIQNRVTLNIVQSMIDTVVSKITKNKPKPYFLTDDGVWDLQRKAEKLTKFAEGQFYGTDFYAKSAKAFKDACIAGTGAVKIFVEDQEIKCERVFINELMIDDKESFYGEPRQIHQKKWVHKDVLSAVFPKSKGAIEMSVDSTDAKVFSTQHRGTDMVLVVESWHLKSGKNTKDGRHTICIANETLFDEDWSRDSFPFVFFKWNEKPVGFFGQGIAEQLTGLQTEINKILRTIQVSMHLVSVPKIFVEASSKIVSSHLNNKIGGIIKYAGQPPIEGKLGSVPPELFAHLERLYEKAFQIVGVSQLSAQSTKPAGLNSGKALRTYNDLESERFMEASIRYEKVFLDASKLMIEAAKQIAADTGNFSVKVPGSGFLKTIDWDSVCMEEDQYTMEVFPTSALSDTPSDRFQEVQELIQAGFISKEDASRLLDFPDLKAFRSIENADVEDIDKQIEMMVDKGEYSTPEPYQNLKYGIPKMQKAYLRYRSENAPEDRLELLRRWIEDANDLIQQAAQDVQAQQQQAQASQAAPAQGAQPLGQPAAPPTSDLVPLATAGTPQQ